jgi:adenosylcobinamide-GDP ribazoletransferase
VAVLLLAANALATGGLHLDGLMDTADGVFGGRTVERRLEIMRDSRIGAFGALAGGLTLLGQYACLSELTGVARLTALVVALSLGRWTMAAAIGAFPSARATGLGATFHQAGGRWPLALATGIALAAAAAAGLVGLCGFGAAVLVTLLGGRFLTGRLGGLTGDTYGALAMIAETFVLYIAVGLRGM